MLDDGPVARSSFAFPQRLMHAQAMAVLEALRAAIDAGADSVDLSSLAEFDSSALSVLLAARRLQRADLPLRCVNAPEKLRKLANLYGVDTLIFDDL